MTWPPASRWRRIVSTAGVAMPCVSPCLRRSISDSRGGCALAARCGRRERSSGCRCARARLSSDGVAEPSTTGMFSRCARTIARSRAGIAKAFLLLERGVVLFVDDDQAGPQQRAEDGRARADDDRAVPSRALRHAASRSDVVQPRVQHGERRVEARPEARDQLRGERDLGHQHERLFAALQNGGDRVQIDLGLAAAGHAVQQMRSECAERRADAVEQRLPGHRSVAAPRVRPEPRTAGQQRFA